MSDATVHPSTRILELLAAVDEAVNYFPCTCWINKPKCPRCELKDAYANMGMEVNRNV